MQLTATEADVEAICTLVYELCGVYLDNTKGYLIESRLADMAERLNCPDYSALAKQARMLSNVDLRHQIVDKMTTNETLFFRDRAPFEAMEHKIIPHIIDSIEKTAFPNRIRIWSAGCSTGQEPYSIAMTLCELLPDVDDWDISILATDVSEDAIRIAKTGTYTAHQVERGLPERFRDKYFTPTDNGWCVNNKIRSLVKFEQANLHQSLSSFGNFQIIFCRNVAIYFTQEDRVKLFERFSKMLGNSGYLFVGSAEQPADLKHSFFNEQHCRTKVYRPIGSTSLT